MTTLRFKWSVQYNHKILSTSAVLSGLSFSQAPIDRARQLPEARPPWRSPRARRQRTERFLIYTLQRHEHVQRGFGPAAWVELVRLAARDRTDAAIAKPSKRRLFASTNLAAKFPGMPGAPFAWTKSRLRARDRLAAPSSPSRQRRGLSGRSHLSSKQMPKSGRERIP